MNAEIKPAVPTDRPASPEISRLEKGLAGVLLVAALFLRCFYIFRYRYDSDEPQHLHTTWGWTQGLLQYRDFFDNHTPLFHILFSPLVRVLGERANILDFMRFAMVPLWFVSLGCVYQIGAALFSRRAGLWAAVFISLLPWWFYCALEYRTDNLWTPLLLGAIALLVGGKMKASRGFSSGMLFGLAFMVSMKTSLLFVVAGLAGMIAPHSTGRWLSPREIGRSLLAGWPVVAGALIAPAAIAGFFAAKGAWEPFYNCVITHNLLAKVDEHNHPSHLRLIFPIAFPFLLAIGNWIGRQPVEPALAVRRVWMFLVVGFYYTALYSFWTLLTRQDYLPFYPLAAVLAAPAFLWLFERFTPRHSSWLLALLGVVEVGLILGGRSPFKNETLREREIIGEFLRLTQPGDYVMDFKGEAVFRQRATYYVMEPLAFYRFRRKMLPDTVAQDLIDKQVHVVLNQNRWYPKDGGSFMTANYLAVGRTRVAGKVIAPKDVRGGEGISFEVKVPGSYVVWSGGHSITGTLDGTIIEGPRNLSAGSHHFVSDEAQKRVAIFWAPAAEAGFQPNVEKDGWQYYR